jgi:DNA topoisomerase-1
MKQGETVEAQAVEAAGHETKPPARYTDASLVKALEERGIGRPSTYAATIKTIVDRGYVNKKGRELVPTFLAFYVTDFMNAEFEQLSDLGFTAEMDEELDAIANGREDWKGYLKAFYFGGDGTLGLKPLIDQKDKNVRIPAFPLGEHPDTGEPIEVRNGLKGFYILCGEKTASVPEDMAPADLTVAVAMQLFEQKAAGPQVIGVHPVSGKNLILIKSPKGEFIKVEQTEEEVKAKAKAEWVSIPPKVSPTDLTQEDLNDLCTLPRSLGTLDGEPVVASIGRYGPYVAKGKEYRNVDEWRKVLSIDLAGAEELFAQPKVTRGGQAAKGAPIKEFGELEGAAGPVRILGGWYGPYVTDGKTNASLPKGTDPNSVSPTDAVALLAARRDAPPSTRKKFVRRKK